MKRYAKILLICLLLLLVWMIMHTEDLKRVAQLVLTKWEVKVRGYLFYYQQMPLDIPLAQICQESKGDENAYNPSDPSRGLMQINVGPHGALAEWNRKTGRNYTEEMMKDPNYNIEVGVWYLQQQYLRFKDWDTAIMAYNAGPTTPENGRQYLNAVNGYRSVVQELLKAGV